MTTTPASPDTTRADTAAMLRAVASLIETSPGIPVPGVSIDFHIRGEDAAATMAAIAGALPGQWRTEVTRSGEYEWLYLRTGPAYVLHGTRVSISAPAADTCTPAGAKTVTVWQPAAALAKFAGTSELGEVA